MTIEQVKQVLEKYWEGNTSVEEEFALKNFFSSDAVPEELRKYQPLFLWKTEQLQLKGSQILETKFRRTASLQWYVFLKIAAMILLVLTLGIGFYTHYQQERYMDKIFSETYSNPEDALQETKIVIGKISSVLNLAKDKQAEMEELDSLEQLPKSNTVE
jgi:hypothetical protein